jgi:hypothetical protein
VQQIVYSMRFTGQAGPVEGEPETVMKAATTAPSCAITSTVGAGGLTGTIESVAGDSATFESVVRFSSETAFQESGTITFGAGNSVRFSTVGEGYLNTSAIPGLMHGVIGWRIDAGEGQFAGATGLITSNFTVNAAGDVTDHHFGLIFLP